MSYIITNKQLLEFRNLLWTVDSLIDTNPAALKIAREVGEQSVELIEAIRLNPAPNVIPE